MNITPEGLAAQIDELVTQRDHYILAAGTERAIAELIRKALTPTAAEMARDTLVARSLRLAKRLAKYKPLIDVSDLEDDDADDSATINLHMDVVSFLADADAYLLAAQPQPASVPAPSPVRTVLALSPEALAALKLPLSAENAVIRDSHGRYLGAISARATSFDTAPEIAEAFVQLINMAFTPATTTTNSAETTVLYNPSGTHAPRPADGEAASA